MAQLFGGEPCLKAFMLLEARPCLSILPFRFFPSGKIHFPIADWLWQSSGKVEKFDCDFLQLVRRATRIGNPRVLWFNTQSTFGRLEERGDFRYL
jgi:hypothetical protein